MGNLQQAFYTVVEKSQILSSLMPDGIKLQLVILFALLAIVIIAVSRTPKKTKPAYNLPERRQFSDARSSFSRDSYQTSNKSRPGAKLLDDDGNKSPGIKSRRR